MVDFRTRFGIAREGSYQFGDDVKFVVESVGRGLHVFVFDTHERSMGTVYFLIDVASMYPLSGSSES